MAKIPGYYYDEEKRRYFREPPQHLAYMSDSLTIPAPPTVEDTVQQLWTSQTPLKRNVSSYTYTAQPFFTRADLVPKTVFSLTAHISSLLDPFNALRYALPQAVVCSSRPLELESTMSGGSIPLTPEASAVLAAPRVVRDVTLNRAGDMIINSTRMPSGSVLFFVSEISFTRSEKRVEVRPITLELCRAFSMFGSEVGISANGESEVVVHYEALPSCGYVLARTYRPGEDGVVNQETLSSRWYKTDAARWPMTLDGIPQADALTCSPSLSRGIVGAVSTMNGEVCILGLPNADDMILMDTRNTPDESSAFSLTFRKHPPLLHVGTRSGTVVTWDLRSEALAASNAITVGSSNRAKPSVIQIHTLDDHYLLTNCLDSKLLLWDCRMNHQVLSYPSHVNSYHSCHSVIDKSHSFVAAVGDDGTIRVWSLWRGTLLRCIPQTEYSAKLLEGELPAITYTNCLGGPEGLPTLLVATCEGFTPFSF